MTPERMFLRFAPPEDCGLNRVLEDIMNAVEDMGSREGWDDTMTLRTNLVLEELATNALFYGGPPEPGIEINMEPGPHGLTVEISDDGRPFDPLRDGPPTPIIVPGSGRAPVGGLGLHLVRTMTDQLSYRREQGKNRLTMTISQAAPAGSME